MQYNKEDLSPELIKRCQVCVNGGQNIFPDCLDVDPTKDCHYFDDMNNDDPREPDYDCGAYMHIDDYVELKNLVKS